MIILANLDFCIQRVENFYRLIDFHTKIRRGFDFIGLQEFAYITHPFLIRVIKS